MEARSLMGAVGLLLIAMARSAPVRTTRKWDELRIIKLVPGKISSMPLSTGDITPVGSFYQGYGFTKDWLRLEGAASNRSFLSNAYSFQHLDYPHEWYAYRSSGPRLTLQVGDACACKLSGVAAYAKADQTAWLRLQFEDCRGCESTAQRAAVVMGLASSESQDSNLLPWMCAVQPTGPCRPPQPTETTTEEEGAAARRTSKPRNQNGDGEGETTTLETTITSTTTNLHCTFLTVDTIQALIGEGLCKGTTSRPAHSVSAQTDCMMACDMTYIWQQMSYMEGVDDLNSHIDEINEKPAVCKGYAYNDKKKECIIYTGDKVDHTADGDGWNCYGNITVKEKGYVLRADYVSPGCTTQAPHDTSTITETSTTKTMTSTTRTHTTTATTTTTTTTELVESLSLAPWFGLRSGDMHLFEYSDQVHFQKEGMDATLLQLQSPCFDNVDYYMLGSTLPVAKDQWDDLLRVLMHYGASEAWTDRSGRCEASVTIDRIPVDVDASVKPKTTLQQDDANATVLLKTDLPSAPSGFTRVLATVLTVFAVSFSSITPAVLTRAAVYKEGVESPSKMTSTGFSAYALRALVAALLTFILAYVLGALAYWFTARLATKRVNWGGPETTLFIPPLLWPLCLPVAAAAAGAVGVFWLWPSPVKKLPNIARAVPFHVELDLHTGELRPMLEPSPTTSRTLQ